MSCLTTIHHTCLALTIFKPHEDIQLDSKHMCGSKISGPLTWHASQRLLTALCCNVVAEPGRLTIRLAQGDNRAAKCMRTSPCHVWLCSAL